jgi:RNA polymerase sigma-70 factor (ECF subfamily)
MTFETESALVQSARSGNVQAFEQLYRQTVPAIARWARRLSSNDADDLVQATYLRAFRAIAGFRGECRVTTWLCTILRKEAASRSYRTIKHPTTALLDKFEAPVRNIDAAIDLEKALTILSEADRALVYRQLEGYCGAEIAHQLGRQHTQSTLRVQMWRAQRKMQLALAYKKTKSGAPLST